MGEVNRPGAVTLQSGPLTVLQALAMAGGFKDFADTANIRILRRTPSGVQTITFNYKDAIRGGFARRTCGRATPWSCLTEASVSHRAVRLLAIAVAAATIAGADPVSAQSAGSGVRERAGRMDPDARRSPIRAAGTTTCSSRARATRPSAISSTSSTRAPTSASTAVAGNSAPHYDGAFLLYQDLSDAEQLRPARGGIRASPHVSPRDTVCPQQFCAVPTTQTVELVGVPFLRTGSTVDDLQSGVEAALGKHTTMAATYSLPMGGVRRRPDIRRSAPRRLQQRRLASHFVAASPAAPRRSSTPAFSMRWSPRSTRRSWSRTSLAASDHQLSEHVRVFGMAGVSHLNVSASGPSNNTGPSFSAGVTRQFQAASGGLTYSQSFIPTYGFGGTMQNQELTGHLSLPLSRRLSQQSSVSWRRNESLIEGEPSLRSLWFSVAVGYALHPAVRIEGFYDLAHQVIDRPGGVTNRNRLGFQLVTAKPVRIR